ncbi:MAG: LLM class F420-dependent oxidoreductase [Chloroflexi bacterium]|nr:LLM class F420-dependent oxidoreductase [Chloroflexota bacterium]
MLNIGLSIFGLKPSSMPKVAARAEELGFGSIWVAEHLVFPAVIPPTYPYSSSGHPPINPDTPLLDPWVVLSYIAAATKKVKLGTGVYILPLRSPFVTARAVTTLDRLSEGRVILGVGVGWLKEEFQAVGENWENRLKRTRETVEIIRKLWTEETIAYKGQYYSFDAVKFQPKPVQKPCIPIEFGGETKAALRRAAELGDGWIAAGRWQPDDVAKVVAEIQGYRREAGRTGPFNITCSCALEPTPENVRRYEAAGATRVYLRPAVSPGVVSVEEAFNAYLERVHDTLLTKL